MGEHRLRAGLFKAFAAIALGIAVACSPMPAMAQGSPQTEERRYDIAAQPLASALAEFGSVSGVNIIYPQSLARGRRSTAISGVHTAPVALQTILRDTGLSVRFTGPNAAVIFLPGAPTAAAPSAPMSGLPALQLDMAEVRAPLIIGTRDRTAHNRYALAVLEEIRRVLQNEGGYQGRTYRIDIALAISAEGRIGDVALVRPSGSRAWDDHVVRTLRGRTLSTPPPADLSGTIRFAVETDSFSSERR